MDKMTWVAFRCVNDGYETWRTQVAEFETKSEAEYFAEVEERCDVSDVWYTVDCVSH
jgi:hypothetical protein